jgi:hypothetical protein
MNCSYRTWSDPDGISLPITIEVLRYFNPRFFFSMTTCVSKGSEQIGQTYRWIVSLRSGSRICLQLGQRTTSGLSDSYFDIEILLRDGVKEFAVNLQELRAKSNRYSLPLVE